MIDGEWMLIASASVSVGFGVLIFGRPPNSLLVVEAFLGVYLLTFGAVGAGLSLRLRRSESGAERLTYITHCGGEASKRFAHGRGVRLQADFRGPAKAGQYILSERGPAKAGHYNLLKLRWPRHSKMSRMERLQKVLSTAGVASRRASEELIRQGRVSVNGVVVSTLGSKADPLHDEIRVDGRRIKTSAALTICSEQTPRVT